jgi:hypothetical protein
MFKPRTKRISAVFSLASARRLKTVSLLAPLLIATFCLPAAEIPTAKGGSLGVRTNDGRMHFTLSADAIWHLNVTKRFDASALTFYKGKLLTLDDRDGAVHELTLETTHGAI